MIVVGPLVVHERKPAVLSPGADTSVPSHEDGARAQDAVAHVSPCLGAGARPKDQGKLTSPVGLLPEEQLSTIVNSLARMQGDDQAACLLGLTTGEVAAHRARTRQKHMRLAQSVLGLTLACKVRPTCRLASAT
jgi:hypothetical protein